MTKFLLTASAAMVVPASRRNAPGSSKPHPGVAVCYLSDDSGKTWRKSRSELQPPQQSKTGLQEPGVVELKDGRIMMLCRTDQGSQFTSDAWQSFMKAHGLVCSMSRRGNCHDNAVVESFFQLLKRERIRRITCAASAVCGRPVA